MAFSEESLATRLDRLLGDRISSPFCIALSGGLDSTVLLQALAALGRNAFGLRAVHIDHGLHDDAKNWSTACADLCADLDVSFRSIAVSVPGEKGRSLEEEAREVRYQALGNQLERGEVLMVAHHADDQMETVLLQLLRGAGPAGLAAMPGLAPFSIGWLCRPLLGNTREELAAYASANSLCWQTDPSNRDIAYDRNYLRHQLIPVLKERWPSASATVSRSARHCAEAVELINDLAALDLAQLVEGKRLSTTGLSSLSPARQRNVVRSWLRNDGFAVPDSRRLQSILDNVVPAADDAEPEVTWEGVAVRRYRHYLYAMADDGSISALDENPGQSLDISGSLDLGKAGRLVLERCEADSNEQMLDWERLQGRPLSVRRREGGERIRIAGQKNRKSLKNLFQEAGVLPWMRNQIPLFYDGDTLVAVGDLWVCADAAAQKGQEAVNLRWLNRPDLF
jgi:tRNA(Ile)-lysidine synthase